MIKDTLKDDLYENGVYDAWQFVINTGKTISVIEYCRDAIIDLIGKMAGEHDAWKESLFNELMSQDNKVRQVSITTNNLPAYKIKVGDIEVTAPFLLDKLIKDFFQYSRNAFDSISQIANAACLASKAKKTDSVDFPAMLKVFNQLTYSQDFPYVSLWYNQIATNDKFIYIDAFNNRTKHTCDVYLKISMSLIGDNTSSEINPFFRKNEQHDKRDIITFLNEIFDFVNESFETFLVEIEKEYPKKIHTDNRINKLMAHQQKMTSSKESDFSYVYFETEKEIDSLPMEMGILLLNKVDDGEIYSKNCEIDTILIKDKNKENEYIGKYVANEPIGDDTLLKYRKYSKVKYIIGELPLVYQAMIEWKQKAIFYKVNPFIDVTTVSDDEEFLKRIQIPF